MRHLVRKTLGTTVGGAALAVASIGVIGVPVAHAATTHGCPDGYVCIYPDASWNNDTPSLKFYNYGAQNLSGQVGSHRVFNNQTDGAVVQLCTAYDGGGCGAAQQPGWYGDVDLTPINSVLLAKTAQANNQEASYDFLVSIGYTSKQASGVVGNLMQESGPSVNPNATQSGGPGRGIAQWSVGGRWDTDANDNVVWYANQLGMSPWSLDLQLRFIQYELDTYSHYGKAPLVASTTIHDGTVAFQDYFEGCGDCNTPQREAYANQVFNAYGG